MTVDFFQWVGGISLRGCKVEVAVGIHGNKPGNETLFSVRAVCKTMQRSAETKPDSSNIQCLFYSHINDFVICHRKLLYTVRENT